MDFELSQNDFNWANEVWNKIEKKMSVQCDRVGEQIPYIPKNGKYEDMAESDICWWTNGFWPGMLWQMYSVTKDDKYKTAAEGVEAKLDKALEKYDGLHHDVGFMWLHSAVANYRITGNDRSRARGMHAAHMLAGRYNPRGKFIRSWNRDRSGWVIIDSMMNIPLLYWAKDTIKDPRFEFVAKDHADKLMNTMIREDGSCNHIIVFDPYTGEVVDNPAGQGYASGSSWSRGQSWAIYGYALSYHYTGEVKYLQTAKKVAHYFIANIIDTGYIPLCDFRTPKEPVKWDTTAGVCAACGMLEIAKHVDEYEKELYINAAIKILKAIEIKYCNWNVEEDSIVDYGSGSYHTTNDEHVPIIYGDYFLIEAILRLLGKHTLIW